MSIAPPESDETGQARRDARRQEILKHHCPYCDAPVGERCRNTADPRLWSQFPHVARTWLVDHPGVPNPRFSTKAPGRYRTTPQSFPNNLTDQDYAVVLFVNTYFAQHYHAPTYAEVGEARGMTEDEARQRIEELDRLGVPLL